MSIAIDEAIKTLSDSANSGMTTFNEKYKQAQLLGIEALNEVKRLRSYKAFHVVKLLLGETEDCERREIK